MEKGFTLIEITIVLAILALLISLAIPSYYQATQKNKSVLQVNQLVSALQYARSEAIKRQQIVTLCKSSDGQNCNGSWSAGFLIFVDHKVSGQVDPGDEILRVYPAVSKMSRLQWKAQRSNDFLQLKPDGTTRGQAGSFYFYPDTNNLKKVNKVIVSYTGRIRTEMSE